MAQVLTLASRATRTVGDASLLRFAIVGGCALALILARTPLGL